MTKQTKVENVSVEFVLGELNSMDKSKALKKKHSTDQRLAMQRAFAGSVILKATISKTAFTAFKEQVTDKKSEKTAKVLGSFAGHYFGNFPDAGSQSVEEIIENFAELELKSWNDFLKYNVPDNTPSATEFTKQWLQTMLIESGANIQFCGTDEGRDMLADGLLELLVKVQVYEQHDENGEATPEQEVE